MAFSTGPYVYNFNNTYYENAFNSIAKSLRGAGEAAAIFNDNPNQGNDKKYWYDTSWASRETSVVNGVVVDNGIEVSNYLSTVYNGDQPLCFIDKIAFEIAKLLEGIPVLCEIGKLLYSIIDFFTDLFGTFICTATLKTQGCDQKVVAMLKDYRDEVVTTLEDGKKMIRYYSVIGPRIVDAINEDKDKDQVYKYLSAHYIEPLVYYAETKQTEESIKLYFNMLNEMVKRYKLNTSNKFEAWVREYADVL